LRNNYPYSLEAPRAGSRIGNMVAGREEKEQEKERHRTDADDSELLFTLQFGAFQEEENAEKLFSAISGIFPEARIENSVTDAGAEIFRVRSGRYRRRSAAERDSLTAMREYGYNSRILTIH
ncbi:MAG: hypothetical protein GF417_08855, partial [Candidatus Latescibacteria bacterium]|nr:hypothetical protein [bacterium]MBD3424531.1 hypothetical protein [Candidatus Latescibacterota bacterium]